MATDKRKRRTTGGSDSANRRVRMDDAVSGMAEGVSSFLTDRGGRGVRGDMAEMKQGMSTLTENIGSLVALLTAQARAAQPAVPAAQAETPTAL